MENKLFEIRDRGTFIPALAVRVGGSDGYLARRAGFASPDHPLVILIHLVGMSCQYDPYQWGPARTMRVAHDHIEANWANLESGAVIDVQFILRETIKPKKSEQETAPC
ncbi:MAG: hypothetical protein ACRD4R_06845 [Candidatus Acidiferrales bacterium]